jgi:hypothetical protein
LFSPKTLDKSTWDNTTLAKKGNLAEEIANLKKQNGKDISFWRCRFCFLTNKGSPY